jgi:O-antigen ligase
MVSGAWRLDAAAIRSCLLATVVERGHHFSDVNIAPEIEHGRFWLSTIVIMFLGLGLIFKSFLFVDGEPVAVNYIFNGIFIAAMLVGLLMLNWFFAIGRSVLLLLVFSVAWAVLASWASGIAMNYVATFAMLVMLSGCFYAVPVACVVCKFEPWRLINLVSLATVFLSALMWGLVPNLTVDPESGRFSGFFISVAVACNFFFFSTVLSAAAALRARTSTEVYIYSGLALLSFILMYLTRTRSVLIETLFILMVFGAFAPLRRGVKMVMMSLAGWLLVLAFISGTAVSTGLVSVDEQLQEFRLADGSLTESRNRNWDFGLRRIAEQPVFGEGLLTKQTEGGTKDIDLGEGGGYNQAYDPHSLPLSLAVEGGIPFMFAMMGVITLVLVRFLKRFGMVRALQSPDFVIVAIHFPVMMFAGGDLTTLGNMVEKVFWILVGSLEIKNSLVPEGGPRYNLRHSLRSAFGHNDAGASYHAI